ncbi:hypothetical protein [Ramlibacter sp.]|uniref:hypothetical protein n=1 Tax=Ramlibacter sp. TaxID=1917967 RepID=UPI0025E264B4|nr:hypothetical protein [Ramlibacter sp.]
MDPRAHHPTVQNKSTSIYGFDVSRYVSGGSAGDGSAHDAAVHALTHGGMYPIDHAVDALGLYDRAALAVFQRHPQLEITALQSDCPQATLQLYVNTLGRLHIRPVSQSPVRYDEADTTTMVGYVAAAPALLAEIDAAHTALLALEATAQAEIKASLDGVHARGELPAVLEEVIDHIEHVESVCFFVRDRFFALIERYVNLIDDKRNKGFLSALRDKPYDTWDADEVLVVAALHALFLSGRSVRFEEFNGIQLSAHRFLQRLREIGDAYSAAGCGLDVPPELDLFERARTVRQQTFRAVGQPYLRYRWIYGMNFQKSERVLPSMESTESPDAWWQEFKEDYVQLVGDEQPPSEHVGMSLLAHACLSRDVAGVPCGLGSDAVNGWLEYLMEKCVASATRATGADYGMSSSLRNIRQLVTYDEKALSDVIHAMTPASFFTCFVSDRLIPRMGADDAAMIASSVQKRMMFNRWHFIPGNLERPLISAKRHWYYPPLIPDIAIHADMHRAAHNKARVKYSVRSPGPDMSRPALTIAGERFRGFYDVRVVRMEGDEFTTDDVLRVRRRTLWLEAVYVALTAYLMSPGSKQLQVTGFQVGQYLDLGAPKDPDAEQTPIGYRPAEPVRLAEGWAS